MSDLAQLRAALTEHDQRLVDLVGERMRLIREVAAYKAEKSLPSFDREREGAHLDELIARGCG